MTTTSDLKKRRPEHYRMKAARTAIYRALYGWQDHDRSHHNSIKRSNTPEHDSERQLVLTLWDYESARRTLENNLPLAEFDAKKMAELWNRLDAVKKLAKRIQEAA